MNWGRAFTFIGIATLLMVQAAPGQIDEAAAKKAVVESSVGALLEAIDWQAIGEPARVRRSEQGHLSFWGAPAGVSLGLDASLRSAAPEAKVEAFLAQYGAAFGIYSPNLRFEVKRQKTTANRTYVRLKQTYSDIPVFLGEMVVQLDDGNGVSAVLCDIMTDTLDLDSSTGALSAMVDADTAQRAAISAISNLYEAKLKSTESGGSLTAGELEELRGSLTAGDTPELVIYDPSVLGNTGVPCLAWKLTVGSGAATVHEVALVDARSGVMVLSYSLICSVMDRQIYDKYNDWSVDPPDHLGRLIWSEGDTPLTPGTQGRLACDYLGNAWTFYWNQHGRDSIDGSGMAMRAIVDYCTAGDIPAEVIACGFACPCKQAMWDGTTGRLKLGENYVWGDVVGHELTHGVTQYESGLVLTGEPAGINESLSDIWGEFIEIRYCGEPESERWLIGENIPDPPSGIPRSMINPPASGGIDRYSLYSPGLNGHQSCGINDKLCYLLTEGGSFYGYTIAQIPNTTLEQRISNVANLYYECQTNMLVPGSDFAYLYYALTQAAINLGYDQTRRDNIELACRAVEIRPTASLIIKDHDYYNVPRVQFSNAGDLVIYRCCLNTQTPYNPGYATQKFMIQPQGYAPLVVVEKGGEVFVAGKVYQNAPVLSSYPARSFFIKDSAGSVQIFVNSTAFTESRLEPTPPYTVPAGSVILRGQVIALNGD